MMSSFFPYAVDGRAAPVLRLLGVRPNLDGVRVEADVVRATFGFLNLTVARSEITEARVTGPYRWYTAIGPRLSFADHGLTFGTNASAGVCVTFTEPIAPVFGPWKHPGVTLTVNDPHAFVDAVSA